MIPIFYKVKSQLSRQTCKQKQSGEGHVMWVRRCSSPDVRYEQLNEGFSFPYRERGGA